jgi:hypothetical protein
MKHRSGIRIVLAALCLSAFCTPFARAAEPQERIVNLGDSITDGQT